VWSGAADRDHHGRWLLFDVGHGDFDGGARVPAGEVFILDDQTYHYMQLLQVPAYLRTTATILTRLDYGAGTGLGRGVPGDRAAVRPGERDRRRSAAQRAGAVRVVTDYRRRPVRWINAARARYTQELTTEQKVRFLARTIAGRWTCTQSTTEKKLSHG